MWRLDHDLIGRTGEVSKYNIDGFSLPGIGSQKPGCFHNSPITFKPHKKKI